MMECKDVQRDPSSKEAKQNEQSLQSLQTEPRINWKQVMGCLSANSVTLAEGFFVSYSSALFPALLAPDSDIALTPDDISWLASSSSLSAPVGALMGGFLMEHLGRLPTIQLTVILFCASWVITATAHSFTALLIARILIGVFCSIGLMASGVLITETALKDYRGALSSAGNALHSFGILCGYILGAFLDWRTSAWVSILSPLITFILVCMFTAESPLWLRTRGRTKKAQKASLYYYGDQDYVVQTIVPTSLRASGDTGNKEQSRDPNHPNFSKQLWMLLSSASGLKPLIIVNMMILFQHWSGIFIIVVYGVTFFQEVGNTIDPYYATIMIGVIRFLASLVTVFLLRRYKRRVLMLVSTVGMAICMAASAYSTNMILKDSSSVFPPWFPVVCIITYNLFATIGFLTIPWIMSSELFPQKVRGAAQAVNLLSINLFMFASLLAYLRMNNAMGGTVGVQYFFAAVSIVAAIFLWIFCPETHGKSLAEIENYFAKNIMYLGHKK